MRLTMAEELKEKREEVLYLRKLMEENHRHNTIEKQALLKIIENLQITNQRLTDRILQIGFVIFCFLQIFNQQ